MFPNCLPILETEQDVTYGAQKKKENKLEIDVLQKLMCKNSNLHKFSNKEVSLSYQSYHAFRVPFL